MSEKPKYYISTAIAYTSGKPHIGNTYEIVLADAIARYKRSQGYDVYFQTGNRRTRTEDRTQGPGGRGFPRKSLVDNVSKENQEDNGNLMDTSYDKFIRTTDEYHEKQVQKIFKKAVRSGRHLQRILRGNVLHAVRVFLYRVSACGRQMSGTADEKSSRQRKRHISSG